LSSHIKNISPVWTWPILFYLHCNKSISTICNVKYETRNVHWVW